MAKRKRPGIGRKAASRQVEVIETRNEGDVHDLEGSKWIWFFIMPPFNPQASEEERRAWHEIERHAWLTCPERHKSGQACRMHDEMRKRLRAGDSAFADKFKLNSCGLANAVLKQDIRKLHKDSSVCRVLKMSAGVFAFFMDHILDELKKGRDVTDPATAQLFGIKPNGKSGKAKRYEKKWGDTYDIETKAGVTTEVVDGAVFNLEIVRDALPASDKDLRTAIEDWDKENGGGSRYSGEEKDTYDDGGDNFLDDPPGLDDATVDSDDFDDLPSVEEDTMFGGNDGLDELDELDQLDGIEVEAEFEEKPTPRRRQPANAPAPSAPQRRRRKQAASEAVVPATPRRRRRK